MLVPTGKFDSFSLYGGMLMTLGSFSVVTVSIWTLFTGVCHQHIHDVSEHHWLFCVQFCTSTRWVWGFWIVLMILMCLQPFLACWQHSACGYVFPMCPFGFPASLGHLARSAPLTGKFGIPRGSSIRSSHTRSLSCPMSMPMQDGSDDNHLVADGVVKIHCYMHNKYI